MAVMGNMRMQSNGHPERKKEKKLSDGKKAFREIRIRGALSGRYYPGFAVEKVFPLDGMRAPGSVLRRITH
jgi:hypothetical protein